jgi:predicted small lipoprotein YifL
MRRTFLILAMTALLSACGQSGPLYLPGNPSEIRAVPPATPDADDQENNGEEPAPKD